MPLQTDPEKVRAFGECRVSDINMPVSDKEILLAFAIRSAIREAVDEIYQQTRRTKHNPLLVMPGIGRKQYPVAGKCAQVELLPHAGAFSYDVLSAHSKDSHLYPILDAAARIVLGEKFLVGGNKGLDLKDFERSHTGDDLVVCNINARQNELWLGRVEHLGELETSKDRSCAQEVFEALKDGWELDERRKWLENAKSVVVWFPNERPYAGRLSVMPRLPCHDIGTECFEAVGGVMEGHFLTVPKTKQKSAGTIIREIHGLLVRAKRK